MFRSSEGTLSSPQTLYLANHSLGSLTMHKFWILALSALTIAGCTPKEVNSAGFSAGESDPNAKSMASTASAPKPAPEEPTAQEYKVPYPDRQPKDGDEVGVFETDKGRIVFMFFPDK